MKETAENVLILTADPAVACRWADILRQSETQVWLDRQEIPPGEEPDVIVTDTGLEDQPYPADVGLVRIAAAGPADVRLPADFSPRELVLACRMLVHIVRLRRREQQAAEIHQRLSVAAMTDPLTGLPNRRAWDAALPERLATAAISPRRLCLAILDLDQFKAVNDAHGHATGDEVLRESGRAVYDSLRQEDLVARLGGDEFGLLLWVPDETAAAAAVERVRIAVHDRASKTAAGNVTASAGFGVARRGGPSSSLPSAKELFTTADAALHEAKRRGRNRSVAGRGPG